MNCEEFESLLADMLGGELTEAARPDFEAHLALCERCRHEYETSSSAVQSMRELPMPKRIVVSREGDRLVISPTQVEKPRWRRFTQSAFQYAASILIAFLAGYTVHAMRGPDEGPPKGINSTGPAVVVVEDQPEPSRETLRFTLANQCSRMRSRATVASCMGALFGPSDH